MKQRGSAMIFVLVLFSAIATVVVATLSVTTGTLATQKRLEDEVKVKLALEGMVEQAVTDYSNKTLITFPTTRTKTVSNVVCSLTISDNNATVPHTLSMAMSGALKGRTHTETRVVGARRAPSPFYYALFVNNGLLSTFTLSTGSSGENGDIYARGNLSLTGLSSTINGDVESTGSLTVSTANYSGNFWPNAPEVAFPDVVATNYSSATHTAITKTSVTTGLTFGAAGTEYPLHYRNGDLSFKGTVSGKGVLFVNGNLAISGVISYADANSCIAIIATGNIDFGLTASNTVGYMYAGNSINTPAVAVINSKGSLVAGSMTILGPVSVTNDPRVWLDADEGRKLRLPGFWP